MEVNIQIKSFFGTVLFEFSKENNTIKDTLIEAVKQNANLRGADLRGADLRGANLGGANLGGADLGGANLGGANLGGADLGDANLGGADLGDANLGGANLGGADLGGANLGDAGKLSSVNDILIVGPLGSRSAYTQIYRTEQGLFVKCGCFFGTIDDFATKVKETHGDNEHSKAYTRLIAYAKAHFEVKSNSNQ